MCLIFFDICDWKMKNLEWRKLKVLVISDFLKASGMTRYVFNVVGNIKESDIHVDVLAVAGSDECEKVVRRYGWGFFLIPAANGHFMQHILKSYSFFKGNANKYDIIHFNLTALWNFLPILLAAHFSNSKIVINSHNTYFSSTGSKLIMKVLKVLHVIGKNLVSHISSSNIAVSVEAAKWMFTKKVIRTHKFELVANGINLESFKYEPNVRYQMQQKLNIDDGNTVFASVGVLTHRKNPEKVLGIFREILNVDPNVFLLIIGEGPLKNELENLISVSGMSQNVRLLGNVQDMSRYYQVIDAIIMPSVNEGLSTVLLEGQTAGVKIFPSDQIPLGNYVPDLIHPISLDKSNSEWAEEIITCGYKVLSRKSHVDVMRRNGYDIQTNSDKLTDIYRKLLI